ncbi:hypothetical protein QTP86_021588, partial [Hemibagrus guttatus]
YPEEAPEARGEYANSTHTAETGTKPPTLEVPPFYLPCWALRDIDWGSIAQLRRPPSEPLEKRIA